jgi:hypothetical protein
MQTGLFLCMDLSVWMCVCTFVYVCICACQECMYMCICAFVYTCMYQQSYHYVDMNVYRQTHGHANIARHSV